MSVVDGRSLTGQRAKEREDDREAFLAAYRPKATGATRPAAAPVDTADPAVRTYLASLGGEVDTALQILAEFCGFIGETPSEMVERIFDRDAYAYRRRTYYTERVRAFSTGAADTWAQRTAAGNVIRDFFLANGHRIAPAIPVEHLWMTMG